MKLTTILLIATFLQVSAASYAQRVTYTNKQASLEQIFKEIRQQTGYNVLWSTSNIKDVPNQDVSFKDAPLQEVLEKVLDGQALTYVIEDKSVLIKPKEPSLLDNLKDKAAKLLALPANITGTVVDTTGLSLPGASVSLKGTVFTTTTDNKGNFTFSKVPQGTYTLVVTYIGYEKLERTIVTEGKDFNLKLTLRNSSSQLDQVKVIAYGKNTERYDVGSVATVSAKEIEEQPVTNPLLALEGKVPGLTVSPTSGVPGAAVIVQIRGQNTLGGLVSNSINTPFASDQPLFIIDGVPFAPQNNNINQFTFSSLANGYLGGNLGGVNNPLAGNSPFNNINPLDIEEITVLKDADATSIYGTQGSNGVIIITTKKGKAGKTGLNISLNTGPTTVTRTIQMMNTSQYLNMRLQALSNDGLTPSSNPYDQGYAPDLTIYNQDKNTNWFKQLYGGTAQKTNVHATLTGGTENTTFIVSLGSNYQSYNFPGDFADNTYTLHTAFHNNSSNNKFTIDFGTDYSYDQNNSSGGPQILSAFFLPPNYPDLLDANGNLVWDYKGVNLANFGVANPYAYLKTPANLENYQLNNHLQIGYKILRGLNISSLFGYSRYTTQQYSSEPLSSQDPAYDPISSANFGSSITETLDVTPQLSYTNNLGKGKLSALLGGEYKSSSSYANEQLGNNYVNDALLRSIDGASNIVAGYSGEADHVIHWQREQ